MTTDGASGQAQNAEGTQGGTQNQRATGYKIYVRVPTHQDGKELSANEVKTFLDTFAKLLSDLDKHVEVETYTDVHAKLELKVLHQGLEAADVEEADAPGPEGPVPYGGPWSPLYPLYVCHLR